MGHPYYNLKGNKMKIVLFLIMAIFAYLAYSKEFGDMFLNIAFIGFLIAFIASMFIKTKIMPTF